MRRTGWFPANLPTPGSAVCPLRPPWLLYLSPRLTKIEPDGLSTRTHSRVQASSASMNSRGVASLPICLA